LRSRIRFPRFLDAAGSGIGKSIKKLARDAFEERDHAHEPKALM